jgi:DNA-binding HxlR family transcriptional regulator
VRRYDDSCGTAHGLELIGDRWALLVIRELLLGPRRFGQLRTDLPGISANVLTQRLAELEERGIVIHKKLPPPAAVSVYELTPWGYEAEPVVQSLGRWAARSPLHDATLRISVVSMLLSLRTMFDPALAADLKAKIGIRLNDELYCASIADGALRIERQEAHDADVYFEGTPEGLGAAVHDHRPFDALQEAGVLRVSGDRRIARKFVQLFPLPSKA